MTAPERIALRELRNNTSDVLRRVERGETLEVTVSNRPVALLTPRRSRPRTVPTSHVLATLNQADSALRDELAAEFVETTDDLDDR